MANAFQFDDEEEAGVFVSQVEPDKDDVEYMICDLASKNNVETIEEAENIYSLINLTFAELPHNGTRKKVPKTRMKTFPYNVICKLFITYPPKTYIGTGFLIDHETVLTAGHCVYYKGVWATSITVVPGMNGREKPFGEFYATKLITPKGWSKNSKSDLDFAMVKLSQKIMHVKEFFVLANEKCKITKDEIVICGYPKDIDNGYYLYQDKGKIDKIVSNQLFYDVDTPGGQSGSPVYNNILGVVIGIHNYGGNQLNCGSDIALVSSMVKTFNGPPHLEFELDDLGKFVSFRSVSMSTYKEPTKFIGEKLVNVINKDIWMKTVEARDKLKKEPKSLQS